MKRYLILLLLVIVLVPHVFLSAEAQMAKEYVVLSPTIVIDNPSMELVYESSESDPYLARVKVQHFILQHSKKSSYFLPYHAYQEDSVCYARDYKVTDKEWYAIGDSLGLRTRHPILIKDRTEESWVVDNFAFGTYVYKEPMERIKWRLMSGGERTILGHRCRRAECVFRGRHWTAWYAPDLPINDGPYKLDGLPGLVLAAESEWDQIRMEAVVLRKGGTHPINVRDYFGADKTRFITDRTGYYRTISRSKWNFSGTASTMGMAVTNVDGSPAEPMFNRLPYVPYELDWMDKKMYDEWKSVSREAMQRE